LRKNILQTLKFIVFLVVGLALMWLAFRSVDFNKLASELRKADLSWLLLSVFFGLVAFLSRARRWVLLVNPLGYHIHSVITLLS
jgi:glycosyltransferase 2 family protein